MRRAFAVVLVAKILIKRNTKLLLNEAGQLVVMGKEKAEVSSICINKFSQVFVLLQSELWSESSWKILLII